MINFTYFKGFQCIFINHIYLLCIRYSGFPKSNTIARRRHSCWSGRRSTCATIRWLPRSFSVRSWSPCRTTQRSVSRVNCVPLNTSSALRSHKRVCTPFHLFQCSHSTWDYYIFEASNPPISCIVHSLGAYFLRLFLYSVQYSIVLYSSDFVRLT